MAIRNNAVMTTTIKLNAVDEKYVDELYLRLSKEFAHGDWEWNYEKDGYSITCSECGHVTYYPGKMYTKNGDGYPDEYDYDFEIWEEDVENEIEKFIGEKYEDVITDWRVSQDSEYVGEY